MLTAAGSTYFRCQVLHLSSPTHPRTRRRFISCLWLEASVIVLYATNLVSMVYPKEKISWLGTCCPYGNNRSTIYAPLTCRWKSAQKLGSFSMSSLKPLQSSRTAKLSSSKSSAASYVAFF